MIKSGSFIVCSYVKVNALLVNSSSIVFFGLILVLILILVVPL